MTHPEFYEEPIELLLPGGHRLSRTQACTRVSCSAALIASASASSVVDLV